MLTLTFELDREARSQIGLIVLQSDETIEQDMRKLLPDPIELLVSRVPSGTHVTLESLAAMEAELQRAASLFPERAELRAIGYGCTSGTAQIGSDKVAAAVRAGAAAPVVTEPVSAVIAACKHLDIRKLGLLSPYIKSVSERLVATLADAGIEVCAFASFNESEEGQVARIAPASIVAAAEQTKASDDMDALFVSCTNLSTLSVIDEMERKIGVPVLTSNQVLAWDLLRQTKLAIPPNFPGRLATT